MTATVIDLAAARRRRVDALEWIVAECRNAVAACKRGTWQREVCEAELIDAERRLSVAEGMR